MSKTGRGVRLGGVPGVAPAKIVTRGGGVVGPNAALTAVGTGADVVVIDRSLDALRRLVVQFGTRIKTVFSTAEAIEAHVLSADLVIGGVLIPGASAPKLVSRALVRKMQPGAVVVDVAIDQGGCFETSRPTTHDDPIYEVDGVIHYCVANMPGGVPRTSTFALNNATLPYTLAIADKGARRALHEDPHLLNGLNVAAGKITNKAVAAALSMPFTNPHNLL
jgi:alanine dehydrogenase